MTLSIWRRLTMSTWALALALTTAGEAAGEAAAEKWRPLPWHLVDLYYDLDETPEFDTVEVTASLDGDLAARSYVYLAPLYGKIGGTPFYFGMQTDMRGKGDYRGKGFIFSRWGKARTSDARVAADGWSQALSARLSGEGEFVGVRRPWPWRQGAYAFRLSRTGDWLDLSVLEESSGTWIDVGGLRFPGPSFTFDDGPVGFVELYPYPLGKGFPDDYVLPSATIRLTPPKLNGHVVPRKATAIGGRGVPTLVEVAGSDAESIIVLRSGMAWEDVRREAAPRIRKILFDRGR